MTEDNTPPPFLYKYRKPDITTLRHILIDNELWAAKPTAFNDPFDCFPCIDSRGTIDEVKQFIDKRVERGAAKPSREEKRKLARLVHKKGFVSISGESNADTWRKSINEIGVVSFSECPRNVLMWSHYAENHSGVCIEFSTEKPPFFGTGKVVYDKERPTFRPLDPNREDLIERIVLRKADFWTYEREWRHLRVREGPGRTPFNPLSLTSIILGAAITAQFERELRALAAERQTQVPIRRSRFDDKTFRLHID